MTTKCFSYERTQIVKPLLMVFSCSFILTSIKNVLRGNIKSKSIVPNIISHCSQDRFAKLSSKGHHFAILKRNSEKSCDASFCQYTS